MSETIVFSKPSCPNCVKAKKLLDDRGVAYETRELGVDISADELFEHFDNLGLDRPRTAPQIFLNGDYIGGYDQLAKYIEETGFNGTGHTL
jgi:glutaredoxin